MGRRGPAKTPTALRVLKGETRPSQINRDEPRPAPNLPEKPDGMSEDAGKVWDRIMRDFAETGVLTAVDTDIFRAYCEAVVRYQYAAVALEESGPLVRAADRRGALAKNPLHQVVRDNAELMRSLARELGFTPAARVGLKTGDRKVEDPFDAWASRRTS